MSRNQAAGKERGRQPRGPRVIRRSTKNTVHGLRTARQLLECAGKHPGDLAETQIRVCMGRRPGVCGRLPRLPLKKHAEDPTYVPTVLVESMRTSRQEFFGIIVAHCWWLAPTYNKVAPTAEPTQIHQSLKNQSVDKTLGWHAHTCASVFSLLLSWIR